MAETMSVKGTVKNVRTHTQVSGGGGGSAGGQTSVHVSSYEVMTFDLRQGDGSDAQSVPIEVVGTRVRFRTIPVSDGDHVHVTGAWKKRLEFLRASEVDNLTTGVKTKGRRWG
jgi:hypothetical protein